MANCNAKVGGTTCGGVIYKCPKCGLAGCRNRRNGEICSNNITNSGGNCRNCSTALKTI
jgi:hypothetical protein